MQLSDFIDPHWLKEFLLFMIAIASVVVIALFIGLIVHKLYIEFRAKQITMFRQEYVSTISRKLIEPNVEIEKPMGRMRREALGDVMIDILASVAGDMETQVKRLAQDLGMGEYYVLKAKSGSWINRSIAIEKLGFLRLPEMKGFFRSLLSEDGNDAEILARAVLALSFIADDEADLNVINHILQKPFFGSSKFNEYVYTNIIKSFVKGRQEEKFLQFLEALKDDDSIPIMLKRDVIEACGSEVFYPVKHIIMKYFKQFFGVPEVKITCIRALGKIGGADVCEMIVSCLRDDDWRVRAVTAKNAYLCTEDIIVHLKESLHDESYYVRVNAAVSLSKLGDKGLAVLREGMLSTDQFTVDISRYTLDEARVRV
ncbi:MAG TPA: HEAT repeat domain-containing protein [Nitrospiraceae bacterium]|jgi:HEAT repeat protein|nr:HEAT repeat domain-containing protein [Nitrospiraceae bacterium]